MKNHRGDWLRPGSRRQRWKSSCHAEACILAVGVLFFIYTAHPLGYAMAALGVGLIFFTLRDAKRGWKIKGGVPYRGRTGVQSGEGAARVRKHLYGTEKEDFGHAFDEPYERLFGRDKTTSDT